MQVFYGHVKNNPVPQSGQGIYYIVGRLSDISRDLLVLNSWPTIGREVDFYTSFLSPGI